MRTDTTLSASSNIVIKGEFSSPIMGDDKQRVQRTVHLRLQIIRASGKVVTYR